jgi:hypothetical protein
VCGGGYYNPCTCNLPAQYANQTNWFLQYCQSAGTAGAPQITSQVVPGCACPTTTASAAGPSGNGSVVASAGGASLSGTVASANSLSGGVSAAARR